MHPFNRNIGAFVHTANASHGPAANAAGTRNGSAMEIRDTRSIVLTVNVGATSGSPTSFTAAYKLQDSLDGTTFTDVANVASATLTVATASVAAELDVDLTQFCRADATHIRFVETVAFSGGSTPTVLSGATITRGPGQNLPQ